MHGKLIAMIVFDAFKIVKSGFRVTLWTLANPIVFSLAILASLITLNITVWSSLSAFLSQFLRDGSLPIQGFLDYVFSGSLGVGELIGYTLAVDFLIDVVKYVPLVVFNLVYWFFNGVMDFALYAILMKFHWRLYSAVHGITD